VDGAERDESCLHIGEVTTLGEDDQIALADWDHHGLSRWREIIRDFRHEAVRQEVTLSEFVTLEPTSRTASCLKLLGFGESRWEQPSGWDQMSGHSSGGRERHRLVGDLASYAVVVGIHTWVESLGRHRQLFGWGERGDGIPQEDHNHLFHVMSAHGCAGKEVTLQVGRKVNGYGHGRHPSRINPTHILAVSSSSVQSRILAFAWVM
jgi:hypothetical protein